MAPQLRPGHIDDAETIADYHYRCWLTSFAPLVEPEVMEAITPCVARWKEWLSDDSDHDTVVAVDDEDTPIGHCTILGNELLHLFIDPDHHRKGVGRVLLASGEERLRAGGYTHIQLHTIIGNTAAIGLYEANGWVMTDQTETDGLPNGSSYTEHILTKDLT